MSNILITGASRGLGLEFTKQYLKRGDSVIATCRQPEKAEILQNLQKEFKQNLIIEQLEVTSENSRDKLFQELSKKEVKVNVLINNAGIISGDEKSGPDFGDLLKEDFSKVYLVNVVSPILIAERFFPLLEGANEPKIINISSMSGSIANRTMTNGWAYSSSKSALNMMSKTLSNQLRDRGIIVIPIHPGWVKTDMGGEHAPLETDNSIKGMIKVIDSLTIEETGKFFDWQGNEVLW